MMLLPSGAFINVPMLKLDLLALASLGLLLPEVILAGLLARGQFLQRDHGFLGLSSLVVPKGHRYVLGPLWRGATTTLVAVVERVGDLASAFSANLLLPLNDVPHVEEGLPNHGLMNLVGVRRVSVESHRSAPVSCRVPLLLPFVKIALLGHLTAMVVYIEGVPFTQGVRQHFLFNVIYMGGFDHL
jgi:hypothetical protein